RIRQAGNARGWRSPCRGRFLAGEEVRKMIAVDNKGSYGEGLPPYSGAAIQVKNLWKKYGDTEAVRGISFDVNKGEIFGLIGPDRPSNAVAERLSYTGIYTLPRPQRRREHSLRRRVAGHRPTRN